MLLNSFGIANIISRVHNNTTNITTISIVIGICIMHVVIIDIK